MVAVLCGLLTGTAVSAQGQELALAAEETATLIREVPAADLSPVGIDPSGIAYLGNSRLLITDSEIDETNLFAGVNLWETDLQFEVIATGRSPEPSHRLEPNGLDYDRSGGRLFLTNDQTESMFIIRPGADGRFGSADDLVQEWDAVPIDALDLTDVAYRTRDSSVFLLDHATRRIFHVRTGANGVFDGVAPGGDDVVTSFIPSVLDGSGEAEGLGYRASSDTLLLTEGGSMGAIHELTVGGTLLRSIDISFLRKSGVSLRPADIAIAPTSSGSGDSMYVVDRGTDSATPGDPTPGPLDGRLYELQAPFTNLAPRVSAGPDRTISLSQSTVLEGGVVDDGQPTLGGLTVNWTLVSGPGSVTFGDTTAARTMAGFNQVGTYTLRLGADDGALAASDTVVVTVTPSPSGRFTDDDDSIFEMEIEWLAEQDITRGCNPPGNTLFCPEDNVTRGQMAAFLGRALDLAPSSVDRFVDDNASVFEGDIQALAAAGITRGCNPPANDRFCPNADVTRGEMAAFLVRALGLPASPGDRFSDDNTSVFENDIQALAAAGITRGCNPPANNLFCPNAPVTREQMAAFLYRALAGD